MNKLANTILLALALMLSQTAIALHDIQCLDELHTQSCEVCAAHDHSACHNDSLNKHEHSSYGERPGSAITDVLNRHSNSFYLTRAPPQDTLPH